MDEQACIGIGIAYGHVWLLGWSVSFLIHTRQIIGRRPNLRKPLDYAIGCMRGWRRGKILVRRIINRVSIFVAKSPKSATALGVRSRIVLLVPQLAIDNVAAFLLQCQLIYSLGFIFMLMYLYLSHSDTCCIHFLSSPTISHKIRLASKVVILSLAFSF